MDDQNKTGKALLNLAALFLGGNEAPAKRKPAQAIALKPISFGNPSCCLAKRAPVGPGKLPQVRKPGSK